LFVTLQVAVAISYIGVYAILSADVVMLIEGCMIAMTVLLTTLRWLLELCHGTLMSGIMLLDLAKRVPVQVVLAKNDIGLIFVGCCICVFFYHSLNISFYAPNN